MVLSLTMAQYVKSEVVRVRLDAQTRRKLLRVAEREDRSVSNIVRIAIQDYLKRDAEQQAA